MADEIRRVQHYAIDLENATGAGAHVLALLRDGDVNLIAVWGYSTGSGKARLELIPDDGDGFAAAAKAAGLAVAGPETAFFISGDDRRGALAGVTDRLAHAGVDIVAAQAVSDGRGRFGAVIFVAAADLQKAATALDSR
jgi:hypothetical protein